MKNKLILSCAIFCSVQMMATNLVLLKSDGSQQLQDVALIGKWVYVGDDLQLLSHDGVLLAQEPVMSIRKITFAEATGTAVEDVEIRPTSNVIYNLLGQKMPTTEISELPKGIYIINGKKFIKQ
jgi:hypothetical protein